MKIMNLQKLIGKVLEEQTNFAADIKTVKGESIAKILAEAIQANNDQLFEAANHRAEQWKQLCWKLHQNMPTVFAFHESLIDRKSRHRK